LSSSILIGCKSYQNLKCAGADFEGAIIDNKELDYISSHDVVNLSPAITYQKGNINQSNR
jgi:hypothetical protein